jgi:hypothetical protein
MVAAHIIANVFQQEPVGGCCSVPKWRQLLARALPLYYVSLRHQYRYQYEEQLRLATYGPLEEFT